LLSVILLVIGLAFFRLSGILYRRMLDAYIDGQLKKVRHYLLGNLCLIASGLACCGSAIALALTRYL